MCLKSLCQSKQRIFPYVLRTKTKKEQLPRATLFPICLATSYSHRGSPQLPSALKAAASDERRISSSASLVQILVWKPHSGLLSLASSAFLLLPTLALRSRRDQIKHLCSSNFKSKTKKEQLPRATLFPICLATSYSHRGRSPNYHRR
jgi:hypothetical protein